MYELKPNCISNIKQELPDKLNVIIEEGKQIYIERFINGFNSDILSKDLPTLPSLEEYELLFEHYQEEFSQKQPPIFFSRNKSNIELAKGDLRLFQG